MRRGTKKHDSRTSRATEPYKISTDHESHMIALDIRSKTNAAVTPPSIYFHWCYFHLSSYLYYAIMKLFRDS